MADSTKTETTPTAKADAPKKDAKPAETPEPVSTPPKGGRKQPASESSDPAVHMLLAELQTHTSNGNTEAAKDVEAKLTKMGFTV